MYFYQYIIIEGPQNNSILQYMRFLELLANEQPSKFLEMEYQHQSLTLEGSFYPSLEQ